MDKYLVALCMYGIGLATAVICGRFIKRAWEDRKQMRMRFPHGV